MNRLLIPPIVLAMLFVLVSCSGEDVMLQSPPPAELLRTVTERNVSIKTFSGSGSISMDSPEYSGSAGFDLGISRPDSVIVEISGPFGISVGRGLITSSRFTFYEGINNNIVEGRTSSKNLKKVFFMPVEFSDIVEALTGTVSFRKVEAQRPIRDSLDGSSVIYTYADGRGSIDYHINVQYLAITRVARKNEQGETTEEVSFRDFQKKGDVYIPHIVKIARPLDETSISLVYDRTRINDYPLDFAITFPQNARKITLDD